MPTETAKIQLPEVPFKGPSPTSAPKEAADIEFKSIDDIEVEQLPEQGNTEPEVDKPTIVGERESAKVEKPAKVDEKAEDKAEEIEDKPKAEGVAKKEETKLPAFLKPPKSAVEERSGVPKPIVPSGKVVRDYAGYTTEQVSAFKKMSDEGYALATKLIKENQELARIKDTSYLQHPNAYTLDPGFQQARVDYSFAQREQAYWEEQLINMDNGQPLVPITGFDSKTGQPMLGNPIQPTKALEEKVRMMIHNCYSASQQLQGKMAEYPAKYKAQVGQDLQGIENFRKQQFGWVNDPKMLDYSVNIDGLGERSLKQIAEDVKTMIPVWAHSDPMVPIIQDLVISVRLLQAENSELKTTKSVETVKKEEQELVEPSSKAKGNSKGRGERVHGVDVFEVDPSLGI